MKIYSNISKHEQRNIADTRRVSKQPPLSEVLQAYNDDSSRKNSASGFASGTMQNVIPEGNLSNCNKICQRLTRKKGNIYERGEKQHDGSYVWTQTDRESTSGERNAAKGGSQTIAKDIKLQALYKVSDEIRNVANESEMPMESEKWALGPHIAVSVAAKKMFVAINTGEIGMSDGIIPSDDKLKDFTISAVDRIVQDNEIADIKKETPNYQTLDLQKKSFFWAVHDVHHHPENIITFGQKKETKQEDAFHGEQRIMDYLANHSEILSGRKPIDPNVLEGGKRVVHIGGTKGDCADCQHAHYVGLKTAEGEEIRQSNELRIGCSILSPLVPGGEAWHFRDWRLPVGSFSIDQIYYNNRPNKQDQPCAPKNEDSYHIESLVQMKIEKVGTIPEKETLIDRCNTLIDQFNTIVEAPTVTTIEQSIEVLSQLYLLATEDSIISDKLLPQIYAELRVTDSSQLFLKLNRLFDFMGDMQKVDFFDLKNPSYKTFWSKYNQAPSFQLYLQLYNMRSTEWIDRLSEEEKKSLVEYIGSSTDLNKFLRELEEDDLDGSLAKSATNIKSGIDKSVAQEDLYVYRGISQEYLETLYEKCMKQPPAELFVDRKINYTYLQSEGALERTQQQLKDKPIHSEAFLSASMDVNKASYFRSQKYTGIANIPQGHLIRIFIPKGSKIGFIDRAKDGTVQMEVLIQMGSKMILDKIEYKAPESLIFYMHLVS